MRLLRTVTWLFLFAAAQTPNDALANGRFPRAQRLLEDRADPNHLVLAATYGLLKTKDRGANWHHICETSYAFEAGQEVDAVVDIGPGGALLASVFFSLNHSSAPGCNFTPALGGQQTQSVPDFSFERADPSRAIAALRTVQDGGAENQLYESVDGGVSWKPFGTALPFDKIRFVQTVDTAPSDRFRVYVTGTDGQGQAQLLRSDNRGATWAAFAIPTDVALGEFAYIGAVHPTNPDILYVRTDLWGAENEANDGLLQSKDGGKTWLEIYRQPAKLFGFALAPDGNNLLIGYGDPLDGSGRTVNPDALGIYKSSTTQAAFAFDKIYEGSVTCLTWTSRGIYVCTQQQEKGFEVGFAQTADFTLATANPLSPLLKLPDVRGSLDCPACTSGTACASEWFSVCETFSRCPDGGASGAAGAFDAAAQNCPEGGAGDAGIAGAAGAAGSSSAGSAGSSTGGTTGPDAGRRPSAPQEESDCGCRVPGSATGTSQLVGLVAWLALVLRRRNLSRPISARPRATPNAGE